MEPKNINEEVVDVNTTQEGVINQNLVSEEHIESVTLQESVPAYHTISGGPETLNDIVLKNEESIIEPITSEVQVPSQSNFTSSTSSPVPVLAATEESFLDRHITAIIFWVNLLGAPIISSALFSVTSVLPRSPYVMIPFGLFPFFIFIATILLGAFNFHGKRKEIFKGIGLVFALFTIIGLVGFGVCLLIFSGISF